MIKNNTVRVGLNEVQNEPSYAGIEEIFRKYQRRANEKVYKWI